MKKAAKVAEPKPFVPREFRAWAEKQASRFMELMKQYPGGPDVWWANLVSALEEARAMGLAQTKLGRYFAQTRQAVNALDKILSEAMTPPAHESPES